MNKKSVVKIISVIVPIFIFFFSSIASAQWNITSVDCPLKYFYLSSPRAIAIDSQNRPHIAYGGKHLYYAYYDGAAWTYETVDSAFNVGECASIAIDSNNKVHISYLDCSIGCNYVLKYATNASGRWVTTIVDPDSDFYYNSIAIDSSNKVHISYLDWSNGYLKYATNASGSWITTIVDSGGIWHASIAADSSNNVHISYCDDNSYLKYATNASGKWVITTVDSSGYLTQFSSIAVDSSNKAHISCGDWSNGWSNADLKYATNASGSWVITTIDSPGNVGEYSSIAIDSSDKVHISYSDCSNGWGYSNLKYTTNASGTWITTTVDSSGDTGGEPSIAIDSSNNVHISYLDRSNNDELKYATNASGIWATTTIDSSGDVGMDTSIATDSGNKAHISYSDWGNEEIKYATNVSGSWITTTVDSAIQFTSIAIDSSNNLHISYRASGGSYGLLKYATNASGSWVTTSVDSSCRDVGSPSIAIDSNNKVHISYCDWGNYDLKYATNTSGSWVTTTVDSGGYVYGPTSIAIDSSNNAHISYAIYGPDWESTDLKYATNASGSWITTTIDSGGYVGDYTSIAIDSSDNVYFSYTAYDADWSNGKLKYTTNASGSWVTTIVDSGNIGDTSMSIDSINNAHVSYTNYDTGWGNLNLKYATNTSGSWVTTTVDSSGYIVGSTSIAIDSSNNVHISYYSYGDHGLKYATNTPLPDNDNDGVADQEEQGPDGTESNYDGNLDSIPDSQQENVASIHSYDNESYVTLVSSSETILENVQAVDNPSPADAPEAINFPYGFFDFTMNDVMSGGAASLTIYLTEEEFPATYYKYGPTPQEPVSHWYEFLYDGQTGAEIAGNIITLHFVDGQRGDDDLAANGTIVDKGGPGYIETILPIKIDIKPGSFPNSINLKSEGKVPVAVLSSSTFDANSINRSTVVFAGISPLSIEGSPKDVNGDGLLDVVLHFKTQDLNLEPSDTEACLTGKTLSGQEFKGCDSVQIVSAKKDIKSIKKIYTKHNKHTKYKTKMRRLMVPTEPPVKKNKIWSRNDAFGSN
ncbi:MAG: choice-of-anchor U domain-containing protein [Candidatus Omnitrophota bacterium]